LHNVRQAQDSGESVRIMDDLMYALDGLSAKLPASTQQESAVAIAETALTQRGRMALRFALQLQSHHYKADVAPAEGAQAVASHSIPMLWQC
jgi:Wings apart-like protein regulation of heterochromatin